MLKHPVSPKVVWDQKFLKSYKFFGGKNVPFPEIQEFLGGADFLILFECGLGLKSGPGSALMYY